jgi:hypothetical protein
VREQLSFVTLLQQPKAIEYLRAAFDTFRDAYARAYAKHHAAYWLSFAEVLHTLEDIEPQARAQARQNTLRALGRPAGEAALAEFERLRARPTCDGDGLADALYERPTHDCGVTLGEAAPAKEAARMVRELSAALSLQLSRLASEAVRRILARGGARLDQFLQIVQASDSAGLATVLDDELVAFLTRLLAEPVVPAPEALDLFEQLARAYPTVDETQVDAVVRTLRDLLTQALAARREGDPAAAFRLAAEPPS